MIPHLLNYFHFIYLLLTLRQHLQRIILTHAVYSVFPIWLDIKNHNDPLSKCFGVILWFLRVILNQLSNLHCNCSRSLNKQYNQQTTNYFSLTFLFVQKIANWHKPWQCDSFAAISLCDIIIDCYASSLTASLINALHQVMYAYYNALRLVLNWNA